MFLIYKTVTQIKLKNLVVSSLIASCMLLVGDCCSLV